MSSQLEFEVKEQVWPLDKPFRISRGARTEARVIVVTVNDGEHTGRGEATPSKRYGEDVASAIAQLEPIFFKREKIDRQQVQQLLPAGASRNALDCALWDLHAKTCAKRVWEVANLPIVHEVETSFTLSLDSPAAMAAAARTSSAAFAQADNVPTNAPILKLKLGGDDADLARVQAVRKAAPTARLLIDANESWSPSHYCNIVPALNRLGVELIEQPFPANADEVLETLDHAIPVCADESCHTSRDVSRLRNRYELLNVKLDKTGGLTEALLLIERARASGFKLLIGCMVCTSLGIAPARVLASGADYVDLDGPLLMAGDRRHGLAYENGKIGLPSRQLWG